MSGGDRNCKAWSKLRVQCSRAPGHAGKHRHDALSWHTEWSGDDGPPEPEVWDWGPSLV